MMTVRHVVCHDCDFEHVAPARYSVQELVGRHRGLTGHNVDVATLETDGN